MPAIIRLSRHGKKGQAFYHIVVADSRFARDARFIEKIGTYNPRTNPVTVNIKFDRCVDWVSKGAKPSDTMRSILSAQGVMFRSHLQKGVAKGVLTQEQADEKFNKWIADKEVQVNSNKSSTEASRKEAYKKRMAVELTSREARNARRQAKAAAAVPSEETVQVAPQADTSADTSADTPAAEPQA
ncbi:MAG: 30S ribosomal protein S16 [Bacteroidetes bacterium]|nr:MAG: 30S ribosomal protein S16 [Bacteroidota bacterium]